MMTNSVRRFVWAGVLAVAAWGAGAQAQVANRFVPVDPEEVAAAGSLPPGLDNNPVTVVVLLAGDSVASVQATVGQKLSRGMKDGVKAQRISEQEAIRPQIEANGGSVIGSFQSVMNGVKVRIARSQIAALRQIPGVVSVKLVNVYQRDNVIGIPRVKAPIVWSFVPGFRGEGIRVAIVDTGIDYTHANFGGPGTVAAYDAAKAKETLPANPALFGPLAPKVKGGIDLAGDDYNANDPKHSVPKPDPNPLDCNGHGSHVAGTAAGYGVLANGSTYTGVYDTTTHTANSFRIGPGVAPKADLYAVRVFGCVGSTSLVGEALEWAVDNDMDVVNMSLGSSFGAADSSDAIATNNAVKAGIVVVASAGNSGDLRYITGSPASAERAISVAASDTPATVPFANIAMPVAGADPAATISALVANGAAFTSPLNLTVKVVRDSGQAGGVSLGCSVADFQANGGVVGKVALVQRGVCARVAKAIYGQQAGALAVVMVNNSSALPPFEGLIFQNPDTGEFYTVTIPFLGVKGTVTTATSDGAKLVLRDGLPVSITTGPTQATGTASFSSGGPRSGDSVLKPDITAPGSPIISTLSGSGNLPVAFTGTSMAAPHVAGVAALARQAHPTWTPAEIKASIINTGNPAELADYLARRNGSGFVNAADAARTRVIAFADRKTTSANFGLEEFKKDFTRDIKITLQNFGHTDAVFDVAAAVKQGSPHTVSFSKNQVKVKALGRTNVRVTLNVAAATAGNSDDFRDVSGLVVFTPAGASDNAGIPLRVPYYLVPRVSSNLTAKLEAPITATSPTGNVKLDNTGSAIAATADFYTWSLTGPHRGAGNINAGFNLAAAGVQTFDASATQKGIAFAITMEQAWSSPLLREFDIHIDTNGDGITDYVVVGIDIGLITTGSFDGRIVSAVYKRNANNVFERMSIDFVATASTDSSTLILPVLASSLGISAANPRFSYNVVAFNLDTGDEEYFPRMAKYNAYSKAISDGQFVTVPPNGTATVPVTVNFTELAVSPALGLMIVAPDNRNGADEAILVPIP